MKDSPLGRVNESTMGLNESFPENAMAVTIVGEARKFMVLLLPSFLDLKLRLKLVRMANKDISTSKDDAQSLDILTILRVRFVRTFPLGENK